MKTNVLGKFILALCLISLSFISCSDNDDNEGFSKDVAANILDGTYKGSLNKLSTSTTNYDATVTISQLSESDGKINLTTDQGTEPIIFDILSSNTEQIIAKSGNLYLKYILSNKFLEIYTIDTRLESANSEFTFRGTKQEEESTAIGTPGTADLLVSLYKGTLTQLEKGEKINDALVTITKVSDTRVKIVTNQNNTDQEVELTKSGNSIYAEAANISLKYSVSDKTIEITTYKMSATDKIYHFIGTRVESNGGETGEIDPTKRIEFTVSAEGKFYNYVYNSSGSSTTPTFDGDVSEALVLDANSLTNNYGAYNGASLIFTYYKQGEGEYKIVQDMAALVQSKNSKAMVVGLSLGVGNPTGVVVYEVIGGTATVKIVNDKYHISIKNPVIAEALVSPGNESDFAKTVTLTVVDAYVH